MGSAKAVNHSHEWLTAFFVAPMTTAIRKELLVGGLCKREIAERLGVKLDEVRAVAAAIKKQCRPTFVWK